MLRTAPPFEGMYVDRRCRACALVRRCSDADENSAPVQIAKSVTTSGEESRSCAVRTATRRAYRRCEFKSKMDP